MADTKIVRGYSLSAANLAWLRSKALEEAGQKPEGRVSVSETLDGILTEAREKEQKAEGGKQKGKA